MDNEEYLEWLEVHFETPIEQDYHQDTLHELMEFEFEEELWNVEMGRLYSLSQISGHLPLTVPKWDGS